MAEIEYCTPPSSGFNPSSHNWYTRHVNPAARAEVPQDEVDEWISNADGKWFPQDEPTPSAVNSSPQKLFFEYAEKWQSQTAHLSSVEQITQNDFYKKIIDLGWAIVPTLLTDLQQRHRFWFPALDAITGIRPFDQRDAGNGKAMTKAWIQWGKRKGLI